MEKELIIVLDFGGQYNQLIARRVRECNVYAEVRPYTMPLEDIKKLNPKGIIFTGGPNSVYEPTSPSYTADILSAGIPVLGICYGAQLMAYLAGGKVSTAPVSEYGKTETFIDAIDEEDGAIGQVSYSSSLIFDNVKPVINTWMSHTDYISELPEGFKVTAHTKDCPIAGMENEEKKLYAVQFHPEVMHSEQGQEILRNFVYNVCKCNGDWKMSSFVETTIEALREKIGKGKVLCALSGGVDSSVAAVLLAKAVGKQLTCVFVDHGLLRKDEGDEVEAVFGPNGNYDLNFIRVNAQDRFYQKLAGEEDPERKRKIIGEEFIRVFEEEAKKIGAVDFLAQGT
ncbi:MAG: glutamine-hydrolyzing GMP synthase, partial [Eubacterium sp.]|nr:glutamine-hydrolyzing GMP synthase [Eubacterium sp.]